MVFIPAASPAIRNQLFGVSSWAPVNWTHGAISSVAPGVFRVQRVFPAVSREAGKRARPGNSAFPAVFRSGTVWNQ